MSTPAPPPDPALFLPRTGVVRAAVAAVVVDDRGRSLWGVRTGPRGGGQLAVPGGAIDFGETVEAAAEREVLEETGLVVKALPYSRGQPELFVVNHPGPRDHFLCVFVECRLLGGTLENREPDRCAGWEWLTFAQLAARVPAEAVAAWQAGGTHEALCWVPLPQLAYYRDHLGLQ